MITPPLDSADRTASGYRLVRLANGTCSVRCLAAQETFHPVIGPAAEAEALYVNQLRLQERLRNHIGEFVIWDVGLGAAANAITALRAIQGLPGAVRLMSFDHTPAPLEFALAHAESLGYFQGYEPAVRQLLDHGHATVSEPDRTTVWEARWGDFPSLLGQGTVSGHPPQGLPSPDAILFDAYSPAKNPEMWTLALFRSLFRCLDPQRPCSLATYSRSTLLRVTLLVAGFFVGVGHATGEKEETTLAANSLSLIAQPLGADWLRRARRSTSAEPLHHPVYHQAPLAPETWEVLQAHPQFIQEKTCAHTAVS